MAKAPSMTAPKQADPATTYHKVAAFIERVRPMIQADGGDVELVEVTDAGVTRIRLLGACIGCPSSSITLKMGIEQNLKEHVPEVTSVEQVQ